MLKVVELDKGDSLPELPLAVEAVIIMGGPMGVYEENKYPFLKKEKYFDKRNNREACPFLGYMPRSSAIS